jgi:hypothetical protein
MLGLDSVDEFVRVRMSLSALSSVSPFSSTFCPYGLRADEMECTDETVRTVNCALLLWSFNFSKKLDVNGQPIEIDSDMSTGFSDSANTHPLLYQVSMKPREGVVEMLEELESVDSM